MFFLFAGLPASSSADRRETLPHDRNMGVIYNFKSKNSGALPQRNWLPKTCKIRRDFRKLSSLIANISGTGQDIKIGKRTVRERLLPRSRKKSGELWFTNYRELDVSLDPPKLNISGDYISALRGTGPSNFNTHYRLTKGCWRTPLTGTGVPPKFKGEHIKFGLKFRMLAPITLGPVGVTSRTFSTRRAARQGR